MADRIDDFELNLDVSKFQADSGQKAMPEMYFEGKVVDFFMENADKGPRYKVIVKVVQADDPAFHGVLRTKSFNPPGGPEDKVTYYWRNLLESAGHPKNVLDNGEFKLRRDSLLDRKVYCHFIPAERNADGSRNDASYANLEFFPKDAWQRRKESAVIENAGRAVSGVSPNAPSHNPDASTGAKSVDTSDLLSRIASLA